MAAGAPTPPTTAMFAQLECRLIGERTRTALAVHKAPSVRLGQPLP